MAIIFLIVAAIPLNIANLCMLKEPGKGTVGSRLPSWAVPLGAGSRIFEGWLVSGYFHNVLLIHISDKHIAPYCSTQITTSELRSRSMFALILQDEIACEVQMCNVICS